VAGTLDRRPAGRGGSGARSSQVLALAVLLQLLATLLVLVIGPGSSASGEVKPGSLPRAALRPPAATSGALQGPSAAPVEGTPDVPPTDSGAAGEPASPVLAAPAPAERLPPGQHASAAAAGLPLALLPAAVGGPVPPAPAADSVDAARQRTAAVRELLALRAEALLARDESAFLSGVDPAAPELRARQAALFAALEQVPLSTWEYSLDTSVSQAPDRRLNGRYGAGRWWAPGVFLETALAGVDDRPVVTQQHLVFVQRDGRWWLAADDVVVAGGRPTRPALWDSGPVVAERVDDVLVLGRPADRALLREIAVTTAEAVPRVTAAWGADWKSAVVVLVPGSQQELQDLMATEDDLSQIAGVATAELGDPELGEGPTGERILVNPVVFSGLSPNGRRLVLTHELTHAATRRATGPAMPIWLAEGYADHVGFSGMSLPLSVTAAQLQIDVRAGRLPERLPVDAGFAGDNPALAQAYEQAWFAVRLLAEQHGQDGLLRFYRAVGRDAGTDPAAAVERALRSELGTSTAELTAAWRAAMQRELG